MPPLRECGMILQNGNYVCSMCGTEIPITADQRPLAMIKAASGEPNMRVITLAGKELHACPVVVDASRPASSE
jgi:hypothetical protein